MESVEINSLQALDSYAQAFVQKYPKGGIFGLRGDLGVGKTTFVRAVVQALCAVTHQPVPRIISPTYVLHQLYETHPSVDHFDLYRLETLSSEGLMEIGFYEAMDRGEAGGFVFVEWPERLPQTTRLDQVLELVFTPQGREIR